MFPLILKLNADQKIYALNGIQHVKDEIFNKIESNIYLNTNLNFLKTFWKLFGLII